MTEPDVRHIREGLYHVLSEGRSYEVVLDVAVDADGGATGEAAVDGRRAPIHIEARRRAPANAAGAVSGVSHGPVTIRAPMPGRVVAVTVAVGQTVDRGEPLLVLEAMKMESALAAPAAGAVTEVLVQPGQAVQQRQPLLRLTPAPSEDSSPHP